jgi:hypothetical protein
VTFDPEHSGRAPWYQPTLDRVDFAVTDNRREVNLRSVDRAKLQGLNTGNPAGRAAIIRKGSECWLPAGALKDSSGSGKSWADFTTDLAEIGWKCEDYDVREPGNARRAGREEDRPNPP